MGDQTNAGPDCPKASRGPSDKAVASLALFDRVSHPIPTVEPVWEVVNPLKAPGDGFGCRTGCIAALAANITINDSLLGFIGEIRKPCLIELSVIAQSMRLRNVPNRELFAYVDASIPLRSKAAGVRPSSSEPFPLQRPRVVPPNHRSAGPQSERSSVIRRR